MGMAATYNENAGIWLALCHGQITGEEFIRLNRTILEDPRRTSERRLLLAATEASWGAPLTEADVQRVTDLYRQSRATHTDARVAVVASSEGSQWAQLYAPLARQHGVSVIIFAHMEAACSWLGMDCGQAREWIEQQREFLKRPPTE